MSETIKSEPIKIDDQLVSILAFLVKDSEKDKFLEILKSRFNKEFVMSNREGFLDSIDTKGISNSQKFLIGFLAHLYAGFHSKDLFRDTKLDRIRKRFHLSDDFAAYCFSCMQRFDPLLSKIILPT
jgi:hypothetical protein